MGRMHLEVGVGSLSKIRRGGWKWGFHQLSSDRGVLSSFIFNLFGTSLGECSALQLDCWRTRNERVQSVVIGTVVKVWKSFCFW